MTMMRLDEICENYEDLKAKVVSYTTNKAEQARGGQKETYVLMGVDHVSSNEYDEKSGETWTRYEEARCATTAGRWDILREIVGGKVEGKGTGGDAGKEYGRAKGQ